MTFFFFTQAFHRADDCHIHHNTSCNCYSKTKKCLTQASDAFFNLSSSNLFLLATPNLKLCFRFLLSQQFFKIFFT